MPSYVNVTARRPAVYIYILLLRRVRSFLGLLYVTAGSLPEFAEKCLREAMYDRLITYESGDCYCLNKIYLGRA